MSTDYIPAKEKDFYKWQSDSTKYAKANLATWGVAETAIADVEAKRTVYEAKYAISEDSATRTSPHVLARQEARKDYQLALREFFSGYVIYNPAVTDEDRRTMGLTVHDTKPTPMPPPGTEPAATYNTPSPGIVDIGFRDKDEKGHAKPYGIHGAETAWGVLDVVPVDWSELPHSTFATHSPLRLTFDGHDRGKTLYFAVRWENTRGQKGPWTDILSAIIP
jgi:hypothetical protein